MDIKLLQKAKELEARVDNLQIMQQHFIPEHTNGVGVSGATYKNKQFPVYKYNLWSTHDSNTDDKSLIMRVGIKSMYDEICRLLSEAKKELDDL